MLPEAMSGWTVDVVRDLLAQGHWEDDRFDFKQRLPDPRDEEGKRRLRWTIAAFANTPNGGWLIFGVSDNRSLSCEDRLVGLPPDMELPERFGALAAGCTPSVHWDFLKTGLKLSTGNVLHIIRIPKGWLLPHGVGEPTASPTRWVFPKRTNKGNEHMSYSEIRLMFAGFYENHMKLQLLQNELRQIERVAEAGIVLAQSSAQEAAKYVTFPIRLLEDVVLDTCVFTMQHSSFHQCVADFRESVRRWSSYAEPMRLGQTYFKDPEAAKIAVTEHLQLIITLGRRIADDIESLLKPT